MIILTVIDIAIIITNGIKVLGSSIAGIFLYLLPPIGIGFAGFFPGEIIQSLHILAIIAVLSGVILATFPAGLLKKKSSSH